MAPLQKGFTDRASYAVDGQGYSLLPFRFWQVHGEEYLLTNLVGEFLVTPRDDLERLVRHQIGPGESLYHELKSRHFLLDSTSDVALDLLAAKYRTRLSAPAGARRSPHLRDDP